MCLDSTVDIETHVPLDYPFVHRFIRLRRRQAVRVKRDHVSVKLINLRASGPDERPIFRSYAWTLAQLELHRPCTFDRIGYVRTRAALVAARASSF